METHDLILVEKICIHYELEESFFDELNNFGLIEIEIVDNTQFIHQDQIEHLEKIIRLYNELDLNIEAIDIVFNLLQKVDNLQEEVRTLKNRLEISENE